MRLISDVEQQHFDNPPKCSVCKKPMKPQIDLKLQRISGFIWRCDECMPKDMQVMLM